MGTTVLRATSEVPDAGRYNAPGEKSVLTEGWLRHGRLSVHEVPSTA